MWLLFNTTQFTPMPRPKSEMTKSGKTIAVRATLSEWNEFKRLGGTKWLRQFLADSIEKYQQVKINVDKQ